MRGGSTEWLEGDFKKDTYECATPRNIRIGRASTGKIFVWKTGESRGNSVR
jgi:hypothetical protein